MPQPISTIAPASRADESPRSTPRMRWRAGAAYTPRAAAEVGERALGAIENGQATLIKRTSERTIHRVDLGDHTYFVKHQRAVSLWSLARRLFRRSASWREFEHAERLAERRVPTIATVAVGEKRLAWFAREDCLVTESAGGEGSLSRFVAETLPGLPSDRAATLRRRLAVSLARLAAATHKAGAWHDDFHSGNVLIAAAGSTDSLDPGANEALELRLIDVPGVRFSRAFDWARSRASLAVLAADWRDRATPRDRLRFWRAYRRARIDLPPLDARAEGLAIEHAAKRHAWNICRRRDRRCLADNRDYYFLAARGARLHAAGDVPREVARRWLTAAEEYLTIHLDRPLRLSRASVVVEAELRLNGTPRPIVLKRTRSHTLLRRMADWFRPSRARRAWWWGHALLARGIATPRPLVVVDAWRGWLSRDGYLASEWIDGGMNLHLYLWRLAERDAAVRRERVRKAAESLGRLVGRMHAWRITHRDLKGANCMLADRGPLVAAWLVDLDGLTMSSRAARREMLPSLGRLALGADAHTWTTRGDRLRFLRAYLSERGFGHADWKTWWREIARHHRRHRQRITRAGRAID